MRTCWASLRSAPTYKSLTSGGTANVNVKGNTQITGALLATIDEEGNDLKQLDFSTGSLNFTDLRNISQNSQTNAGVSANLGVGEKKEDAPNPREGQPTAEGANGKTLYANTSNLTYSNTQQNSADKTLATLGHGNITVGGTQLEKDGELTDAGKATNTPLILLNRDTGNTTKELWNSEQSQTVDATLDHRLLTEDGRKQIKNDAVDTKEFGEDIGRAVGTVRKEEALGVTDFWHTLDNNTKATQIKNELTRNPQYAQLLKDLKSQDGDTFAQSFAALGQMAQAKFGISPEQFSEIFLYSGKDTTSTSLGSTLFVDTKGGTVLDKNNAQFGNIFINADGSVKTDLLNTLGHETVEAFTLRTDGKNDEAQEAQANAFGTQFSDRINQAAGSNLDSTGGSTFNASLQNSYAVTQGTLKANTVGNAEVDNRKLNSQFAMGLPNYIAGKKAQGDMKGAQAAEVLLILGALAEKRGPTDNLNAEIDQLDVSALGVSPESLEAAKLLPDAVKKRIVTAEPSDFCKGTACTIGAEVADSMVNLESMTDLAVEFVGGKLIDAGIDAYKVIKASGKAADEMTDAVSNVAADAPKINSTTKVDVDGEMAGQPEPPLELPKFTTNGKLINEPETIPVGQEMIAEYMKMGANYDDAIRYVREAIASGTDIPIVKVINEPLYKIVPKGSSVSDHTVFWMTRSEVDRLIENPAQFAKNSGLPLQSNSVAYDVYKINPKEPAKVFESKIADTQQGAFKQEANATQTLVPNRKQFTEPEKVFEFGGNKQ